MQIGHHPHIGGRGGACRQFSLGPGEVIVKVYGTRIMFEQRLVIGQITFESNFGQETVFNIEMKIQKFAFLGSVEVKAVGRSTEKVELIRTRFFLCRIMATVNLFFSYNYRSSWSV